MSNYIRLTYASSTTSKPATIRHDLVAILNEAQMHNSNRHLWGALLWQQLLFSVYRGQKA